MIKIDFHVHSEASNDSFMNLSKILKIAKTRGLDGIALVDHYESFAATLPAASIHSRVLIIQGCEAAFEGYEIIGLFLSRRVNADSAITFINQVKQQGGITVLAHPFKRRETFDPNLVRLLDSIEGFNARTSLRNNIKAQALADTFGKPAIAGSDAHNYWEIGNAYTLLNTDTLAMDSIKKALLREKITFRGKTSPFYEETISQIFKSAKLKNPKIALKALLKQGYSFLSDNERCD